MCSETTDLGRARDVALSSGNSRSVGEDPSHDARHYLGSPGSLTRAFSAVANSDQPRYGASADAASRPRGARAAISAASTASSIAMTVRDARLSRTVKNTHGHAALSSSCPPCSPHSRAGTASRTIRRPATPIEAYNAVHTGPNSHAGGAQTGFSNRAYTFGARRLPNEPTTPATTGGPQAVNTSRIVTQPSYPQGTAVNLIARQRRTTPSRRLGNAVAIVDHRSRG